MKSTSHVSVSEKLEAFRHFAKGKAVASCRLVHYVGLGKPNGADVPLGEVESQVSGCLAEGFHVSWLIHEERLYICVQEPGCQFPSWERVIAEEAVLDVDQILREAGIVGGA